MLSKSETGAGFGDSQEHTSKMMSKFKECCGWSYFQARFHAYVEYVDFLIGTRSQVVFLVEIPACVFPLFQSFVLLFVCSLVVDPLNLVSVVSCVCLHLNPLLIPFVCLCMSNTPVCVYVYEVLRVSHKKNHTLSVFFMSLCVSILPECHGTLPRLHSLHSSDLYGPVAWWT